MITVILLEPENSGNVGAIARVMKNFELAKLMLVNPKCDCKSSEAIARAMHGKDVLLKARVVKKVGKYDYLVGTTSKFGSDYNIPRSPISVSDLASKISKKDKVGLLIGREGNGLTNAEIDMCDFIVTIPASKKYPVLNISHACGIIFYELFKDVEENSTSHFRPASKKDREVLLDYFNSVLDTVEFATPDKKNTQRVVFKRVIGKALLTKREAFALIGLFKKLQK